MAKHKKYSILEFATSLSGYDANTGRGYGKITNGSRGSERSTGSPYGIYDDPKLNADDDNEEKNEEDIDTIDLGPKIGHGLARSRVDIAGKTPDTDFANIGYAFGSSAALTEMTIDPRDDATTPVVKGITPRLSYSSNNTKGPAMSSMASSHYITTAPGRIHGTEKGTSRAPAPQPGEENLNPIFSLSDMLDNPEEYGHRKLKHRENTVKKIIESIYF